VQTATHIRAVTDGISLSMQRPADCISKTTDGFVKCKKPYPVAELDLELNRVSETVPMACNWLINVLLMEAVRHLRVAKSNTSASPLLTTQDALQAFGAARSLL